MLNRRMMIAAGLASLATRSHAAAERYQLVPDRAQISFAFSLSGTVQTGTVPLETADIRVDTRRLSRSSADVTADIRQARTGMLFVTRALLGKSVLNAAEHPIARYRSRQISLGAGGRLSDGAEINGDLTLRGVTLPMTLAAQLTRPPGTAPDDLSVLTIALNGALSRSAFGATGYPNLVEDEVRLDIIAEIQRAA
ncbi:YceI family protein [uncultured Roseobacter sp.]|uniref:YceI family protein n=1 Tax=uncultured Roseobacter sp. TaxID=114847 RepID=UPI002624C84A|nr:YceI family protein [uncultured Roseobacter sp.]